MFSSFSPFRAMKELLSIACLTATVRTSASRQSTKPAIDFSFWTSCVRSAVIFSKILRSATFVLSKRLEPCSNCKTTKTGVCRLRSTSKAMTILTAVSTTSLFLAVVETSLTWEWLLIRSRSTGRVLLRWGGAICSSAWLSSAARVAPPWAPPMCRKTATVLRSSSTAMRMVWPGLGPMVPKMGIIWNCVAQCVTMCSASSILPRPVGPSITTMPPSAKGLPAGALALGGPVGIAWSLRWIWRLKPPPSISCTFRMPAQRLTLQSCRTLALQEATTSFAVTAEPSMGLSYQGKRIFRSRVKPMDAVATLGIGLKTGIALVFPLTLMGGRDL
mmetsp:Transcript_7189/g.20210  ORF Transcript_7189/g.20210 Transcript_7189/m.20210 type:complete len:331 (-) Transcript_7189:1553-2545(-)